MLITKKTLQKIHYWRRLYFPTGTFFARIFSSNTAKQLASAALQAGKNATKDIGVKAIDMGETVTIDAGKNFVEKVSKKLSTPPHKWLMLWFHLKKLVTK